MDTVRVVQEGPVTTVTIDRPPLNVLDRATWDGIAEALEQSAAAGGRVVVITGAGRAFSAGSDIREMEQDPVAGFRWSRRNVAAREAIRHHPWPVIAAVNGLALGGGLALALVADVRVAARSAVFGLPEATVGLVGAANYLLRYLPVGKVKELAFTAHRLTADEALAWGLVETVVDDDQVLATARAWADDMAKMPPTALRLYKETINRGLETGLAGALDAELEALRTCWGSEDRREAVAAFLARRRGGG